MKNTMHVVIMFVVFAILGVLIYPLAEGERLFTPATFIITQLAAGIYIRVLDILDLLKEQSK